MKKRYWALGLITLEILCWPAAAQILDQIKFEMPQRVVHAEFPGEPGLTRMFVTSNAPFAILAKNQIGEYDVTVIPTGVIGGQSFGENAQLPGEPFKCAATLAPAKSIIYAAERKTAKTSGDVITQSVMVEIRYDKALSPKFDVVTEKKSEKFSDAAPCQTSLS